MANNRKKKKIISSLQIEKVAAEGKCIGYDGEMVVFVEGVAPGDVVDVLLTKKKKNFAEGRPLKFISHSSLKQPAFCSHFGVCGGCKWQHLPYSYQLEFKQSQVKDAFDRIGKLQYPAMDPIIGAKQTQYYRNKLEFTFSTNRWLTQEEVNTGEELSRTALGFHIPGRFDRIVDVNHCYLQGDPSNAIRLAVKHKAEEHQIPFFDIVKQEGFLRNLLIRNTIDGEWMVILQVYHEQQEWIALLLSDLQARFPEITSLLYFINPKGNETFHDLVVHCYAGKPYIEEKMEGLRFRIGPKSFYQTNSAQAYELYKVAREFANLDGTQTVYDLYTGTGTIANFVAAKAKKVVGIEYVPEAIEDAKINAEVNGISNALFFDGDMKDLLTSAFIEAHGQPDVIITDPPRAGMHPDVVEMLLKTNCPRIVYVSCNPATQARDLQLLASKYRISKSQAVDMFPHTHHVENVALLELI
jgi:23S rRNA (uracil1939-C5)-methyltransferase